MGTYNKTTQQRSIIQQYGDWYTGCWQWAVPNVTAHPYDQCTNFILFDFLHSKGLITTVTIRLSWHRKVVSSDIYFQVSLVWVSLSIWLFLCFWKSGYSYIQNYCHAKHLCNFYVISEMCWRHQSQNYIKVKSFTNWIQKPKPKIKKKIICQLQLEAKVK